MNKRIVDFKLDQISNFVYCDAKLNEMDIETKLLPNPYYDYPYMIIENFFEDSLCDEINCFIAKKDEYENANLRVRNSINALDEKLDKKIRNTNLYKLDDFFENMYYERFSKKQKNIEEYFKLPITSSTDIQALEYKKSALHMFKTNIKETQYFAVYNLQTICVLFQQHIWSIL